jgi:hypothetical protein
VANGHLGRLPALAFYVARFAHGTTLAMSIPDRFRLLGDGAA